MKDKHLDDIIRKKLKGLDAPLQYNSWELFEQKLEAGDNGTPEVREEDVDEVIFNKLHQLEHPYRDENWSRMSERLDREFIRPGQVLRYKAMEMSLVLLIALTLWQFIPATPGSASMITKATTAELEPSDNTNTSDQTSNIATPPIDEETIAGNSSEPDRTAAPGAAAQAKVPPPVSAGSPNDPIEPGHNSDISSTPTLPLQEQQTPLHRGRSVPENIILPADPPYFVPPPFQAGLLNTLPALPTATLTEAFPTGDFEGRIVPLSPDRYFFFSMFGGPEYNRIITPRDYFLDVQTNEFDRYEPGYSGGISMGIGLDLWEIQSGIIYTAKQYPSINLLIRHGNSREGYTVEQFKDVQLNIIQVPLSLRYDVFRYDRWRLYATAGTSLNVATHANYFIEKAGSRRSLLSERVENGWLEGGTFRENSFLTGNIGFGVERIVTGRWSFFAQPTYQHTVYSFNRGFGPTNDQLNTLSIYTGIRIRMKR